MHGPSPFDVILDAYRDGVFPMAESADDDDFAFYKPYMRGLIPIENLHIPKKLLKELHAGIFTVTMDEAFEDVIDGCARKTVKRPKTWINKPIRDIFIGLHHAGHAHSIECWTKEGKLAGGIYGLAIGGVFCGESMFSNERNASKIALVHLCAMLWTAGFTVLDTQFINPHLLQFGAYEMPQEEYEALIGTEMSRNVALPPDPDFKGLLTAYLARRQD